MDFEKIITERYSVRKFENRHLEKDVIDKILQSALLAPTGCNFQPQRILVMNTDESVENLKKCTRSHFDAPCAMLVCYNKEETWVRPYDKAVSAPVDAAIVTTHMMLRAQDLGIGTCWVMHFNPSAMKETFNIPANIEPLALLVMGYPHPDAAPIDKHFQTKKLEDIVLFDTF